jgi:cytochrome oxidase assembly protein ShyY1
MRAKGLVGMTVFTACMLALLVGLGVWQLKRLEWKEGLIARIEARSKAPPITLHQALEAARKDGDVNYLRVAVEGRFQRSEVLGGWPRGGQTRLALPNNHLQYAITWFVLAFCIAVIYVFYVRSRRREGRP